MKHIRSIDVYRLKISNTQTVQEMADLYSQNPSVEYAQPKHLMYPEKS
jgi:hypothetical protein